MTIRHSAVKATLDVGTAAEWNADHETNFSTRICNTVDLISELLTEHFDLGQETSGTASTITLVAGVAAIRLNATGGVNNLSAIRLMLGGAAGDVTNPTFLPIADMAVEVGGLTANNLTHIWGLVSSADTPFGVLDDGAFFRIDNNVLYAITSDGAVETDTNLGAPNQYGNYRIVFTGTDVRFYVDDMVTPVAIHNTNVPIIDLTFKFSTAQRAGGSNTMSIQAFSLSVLRSV